MIRSTLLLIALAMPASANPIGDVICEPKARMKDKLTQTMRSERQSIGLRGPEQVVEVWADKKGDWTMVITYATGQSCIVAMGEHWTDTAKKDPA